MSKNVKVIADLNLVTFLGALHRSPQLRVLKTGAEVVNMDLCIRDAEGRSEVLPLSWFSAPEWVMSIEPGERLAVSGRLRRQWFGGNASFTDVVVDTLVPATSPAKLRRVLGQAMATLQQRAS